MRDYLLSHKEWPTLKRYTLPLETLMIQCVEENSKRTIISNLYKHLQMHFSDNSIDVKQKWDLKMNILIEDGEWEEVCEKITHSPGWKEYDWKLRRRFFKTPFSRSKYDKNATNLCCRKCNQIGDHTRIFWDCPLLISFWQGVQTEIQKRFKFTLPLNPL